MKGLTCCLTALLLFGCMQTKNNIDTFKVSVKDSVHIEKQLLNYKNVLFKMIYTKSLKETFIRNQINPNDYCYDKLTEWDLTEYYYANEEFDGQLFYDDKVKDQLIRKWLDKKQYVPFVAPPDHPNGSFDMARALDFYNSDDLKKHIDSLREVKYKQVEQFSTGK